MSTAVTRDEVLRRCRRQPAPAAIELACAALAQLPEDDELRLCLVRSLVDDGLVERAQRELERLSPAVCAAPEMVALAQNLRAMPRRGYHAWHAFEARYAANRAALATRYSWAEALEAAWRQRRDELELHRSRAVGWQVWDRAAGCWRPGYRARDVSEAVAWARRELPGKLAPPIAIDGLGLGEPVLELHAATDRTFLDAGAALHLVDRAWLGLAIGMHLYDWRDVLVDPRVHWHIGPTAPAALERAIVESDQSPPPAITVRVPSWDPPTEPETQAAVERATRTLQERIVARGGRLTQRYAGRDAAWWGRRYAAALHGEGPPLRVMAITSRFTTVLQYATRDLLRSFAAAGCETELVIESQPHDRMTPDRKLAALERFEPDLVLVIDHLRAGDRHGNIAGVPFLTWVQDRLPWLFSAAAGATLGPLDFCMGYAAHELTSRFGYPASRFLSCEMATNPRELGDPDTRDSDREQYECDVAYTSHQSAAPEQQWRDFRGKCAAQLYPLVDAIRDELAERARAGLLNGNFDFEAQLERVQADSGVTLALEQRTHVIDFLARPLADRLLRHETLRWAARWAEERGRRLHIYGNGWDQHPEFARYARGPLPHGRAIGAAFRAARVSLHMGCNPALHQRVLDGLASGGFYLFRRHAADCIAPLLRAVCARAAAPGARLPMEIRPDDLPPAVRDDFARMLRDNGVEQAGCGRVTAETLAATRARLAAEDPPDAATLWPEFGEVVFEDQAGLHRLLDRFALDPSHRDALADRFRRPVLERFDFDALARRVLDWLGARLNESRAPAAPVAGVLQGVR